MEGKYKMANTFDEWHDSDCIDWNMWHALDRDQKAGMASFRGTAYDYVTYGMKIYSNLLIINHS